MRILLVNHRNEPIKQVELFPRVIRTEKNGEEGHVVWHRLLSYIIAINIHTEEVVYWSRATIERLVDHDDKLVTLSLVLHFESGDLVFGFSVPHLNRKKFPLFIKWSPAKENN